MTTQTFGKDKQANNMIMAVNLTIKEKARISWRTNSYFIAVSKGNNQDDLQVSLQR